MLFVGQQMSSAQRAHHLSETRLSNSLVTLSTYRRYTNNCICLSIYLSIYLDFVVLQVEYQPKAVPPCRFLGHVVPTRHVTLSSRDKHLLSLVRLSVISFNCIYLRDAGA